RSLINPRQTSAITYDASPLNGVGGDGEFDAGPVPGAVLPECPVDVLADGTVRATHLTDLIGPGFTVFAFSEDGDVPATLAGLATPFGGVVVRVQVPGRGRAAGPPVRARPGGLSPIVGPRAGPVSLIRPDGHVAARWQGATADDVSAAIDHILRG